MIVATTPYIAGHRIVETKGQTFGPKLLFQPIPKSVLVVAEKTIGKIHA